MKRVLCIWFPNWPIQRIVVAHPELKGRPVVLYSSSDSRGARVVRCSRAAARRGVRSGMPVAEAAGLVGARIEDRRWRIEDRGQKMAGSASSLNPPSSILHPYLTALPSDPAADREMLRELARRCRQYSPIVGLEEAETPECLLLDITGCAHLFGGETELIERVRQDFRRWGYHVRAAAAETTGAAWALARYGGEPDALDSLPVEALRLPPDVLALLREFDLETIGQVRALPRESLPSRFGDVLLRRLDQLLGLRPETITPERLPEPVEACWSNEERIENRLAIETVLARLLDGILQRLQARREGVLQLECRLTGEPDGSLQFTIDLARPTLSHRHLRELINLQLERVVGHPRAPESGFSRITLRATVTAPLNACQREIFETGQEQQRANELTMLVNRLSSRLGLRMVLRPRPVQDAQPEYGVRYRPAVSVGSRQKAVGSKEKGRSWKTTKRRSSSRRVDAFPLPTAYCRLPSVLTRPLRVRSRPVTVEAAAVFPDGPPMRFWWRRRVYTVARAQGPERIETGWWRQADIHRDYYRVETAGGERFWLFRNRHDGGWFLQGCFG